MTLPDRYAVFGNPIAHSRSPRIHALFAEQTGQAMRYEALLAALDGFAGRVRQFVADAGGRARGANVTVPFKEEAFRLAGRLTPRAEAARAVNTLCFDGGEIFGDNTDGAGLVRDLTQNLGVTLRGRRILLLGAGGAARGALLPLLAEVPAEVVVANRNLARAEVLVADFGSCVGTTPVAPCALNAVVTRFDVVINATSSGLGDEPLPLPDAAFASGCVAYEMVYGRMTPFMQQAGRAGAGLVADGLGMLVEQAAEAFFLWRGVRPETRPVMALLREDIARSAA